MAQPVTPVPVTPVSVTPVATAPLPLTPAPVATAPSEPVTLPSHGSTTVPVAGENVVVTVPAAESGTTASIPVPPPLLVTPPHVLEPAAQQTSGEVPEPRTITLLLGGLLLIATLRKRG